VLHVIQRYPPALGGAEAWCRGLARRQAARGVAVTVLTGRATTDDELWSDPPHAPGACAVGATDMDDGVRVVRCAIAAPFGPAGRRVCDRLGVPMLARAHSPELYGRLLRLAHGTDVVHAHAVPGPHVFAAWIAARLARRPFALTPCWHMGDAEHESRAVRRVLRAADAIIALTAAEADALAARGVDASRIFVAPNAVDEDVRPTASRSEVRAALGVGDRPVVLFVGRKSPTKGLDVLLDAWSRVRHAPPPALVLAGPRTRWFEALLATRAPASVIDLPSLSESAKSALIAASDLLVLPSKHESFGIVFLEAWRAGTPVVGADVPSVREVLGDGGSRFRPDDPADLARCVDEALFARETVRAAAARGRARLAAEFTWARVGVAVDRAYERAGAGRGRSRIRAEPRRSWA
jgi:glycosyltransferase involved in cell wall biosynthesis